MDTNNDALTRLAKRVKDNHLQYVKRDELLAQEALLANVKAGDTVRLEDGPEADSNYVGGKVSFVGRDGVQAAERRWAVRIDGVGIFEVGPGAWTLTDHQPAPEPEPEWRTGTFVEATVDGVRKRGFVYDRTYSDGQEFMYPGADAGYHSTKMPTDIRPLVVIDLAEARAALADLVVSNRDGDPDGWVEAHESAIWAALGIEVPR